MVKPRSMRSNAHWSVETFILLQHKIAKIGLATVKLTLGRKTGGGGGDFIKRITDDKLWKRVEILNVFSNIVGKLSEPYSKPEVAVKQHNDVLRHPLYAKLLKSVFSE